MKRHLNTLYVSTQDTWLAKNGECVELRLDGKVLGTIPLHTLQSIVCFGRVSCSQFLLAICAEKGVSVTWLTEHGRFMAAMQGPTTGNILLRKSQYRLSDDLELSAIPAKCIVIGKVANSRTVLMRHVRQGAEGLQEAVDRLKGILKRLEVEHNLDVIRGLEGEAAQIYFSSFSELLSLDAKHSFVFDNRNRRPPKDPINALLSFVYALLMNDVRSAIETVGLDPACGFLHRDRPGRPSLALDLMEEFRSCLADRLVLTLINRRQLQPDDFETAKTGAICIKEKARKKIIIAWQERKREELLHPFLQEKMTVGILFQIQARLMARFVRGELNAYPPFRAR